jgi:hypothetical protein
MSIMPRLGCPTLDAVGVDDGRNPGHVSIQILIRKGVQLAMSGPWL